jgi:DNA helicase-2/ATP-dependent DNA helicase PcrA
LISKNRERIKKELVTDNGYGEDVIYFNGTSSYEESMFVCSEIKDLIKKGVSYKEIAILYRSNFLSRNIETELINNSIPYYIYGGIKFYQRLEVKDILAYLKLVVNPYDEISIRRVINKPSRKIGDATLQRISEYAEKNKISFGEAIALTQNYEADID